VLVVLRHKWCTTQHVRPELQHLRAVL
jgi:hypothetical protein